MQISQGSMNSASNIGQDSSQGISTDLLSSLATRVESALDEKNSGAAAAATPILDFQQVAQTVSSMSGSPAPGQFCATVM